MLNKVYELVRPRQIVPVFKNIDLTEGHVIVRPGYLSICHADQRYYQGLRPEHVLSKKLPMALIHEAVGHVIYDPTGTFERGQRVVMIPNTPTESDPYAAENYLESSKFRASGFDGFMQEYVSMTPDRLIAVPESIPDQVAAFMEIVSVSYHAISRFMRFSHKRRETIGIWGDGNLGFITALLVRYMMPETKIIVFGIHPYKLQDFTFVHETYTVNDIPASLRIDHAFECVGGTGAASAIDQMIDRIRPEGTISLLGVSENPVPMNTRMILERGLRLFGSSRSGREDFEGLLRLYEEVKEVPMHLMKLVGVVIDVRNVADAVTAFETDIHKNEGKTIMIWNI